MQNLPMLYSAAKKLKSHFKSSPMLAQSIEIKTMFNKIKGNYKPVFKKFHMIALALNYNNITTKILSGMPR